MVNPRKTRAYMIIVTSQDRVLDVILSDRVHQGTELESFKQYRMYYLDITAGILSSVSFFSSDLPHEPINFPLFKDITADFFNTGSSPRTSETLSATITPLDKINNFTEEDLRYSIESQYRVDEEPLIEFSSNDSNSEQETMINSLFLAQTKNYKKLLDYEKQLRTKHEIKTEEIKKKIEKQTIEFHKREDEIIKTIEDKEKTIHTLNGEIAELKLIVNRIYTEKIQETEKLDMIKLQLELSKENELQKEISTYKELLENMEQKWIDFVFKIQSNHDTDPIHFIIKEKDEKILELNSKLNELSNFPYQNEIEAMLNKKKLSFKRENEYVYSIESTKTVVVYDNNSLLFRKIGPLKTFDEFFISSPQKRSISALRVESLNSSTKRPSRLSSNYGSRNSNRPF
jgi:hypothetical protein